MIQRRNDRTKSRLPNLTPPLPMNLHFQNPALRFSLLLVMILTPSYTWGQDDEPTAADQRKVSALMRLKNIDVNEKPSLKKVVVRYLKSVKNDEEYLGYANRFRIIETNERLWNIVLNSTSDNLRAGSLELLLVQNSPETLRETIGKLKNPESVLETLALLSTRTSLEILKPFVTSSSSSTTAKNIAAKGLGKQKTGQEFLLQLVQDGKLPKECQFTVANALLSSNHPSIKNAATKLMKLPATSGSKPLAPISELVKRKGDVANGRKVFDKTGTCINCHQVSGRGKEVGPNLTEIGSKLSRQAMYESILNPDAAISHNYENYMAETFDGLSFTGLLISETDDSITLRTAEALNKVIPREDLEGFKKLKNSLMPRDLQKGFSEKDLVDLVEYMLTLKKK